jgi:hypothetical protein
MRLAFATIKKRSDQVTLTAPVGNLLLGEKAKQQSNEVDKDVQFVPVYLDKEGFASNLHSVVSYPPSKLRLWGLIALGATCAQGSHEELSAISQSVTPKRKQLLLHPTGIIVAIEVTFLALAGCQGALITINLGSASKQVVGSNVAPEVQCAALLGPKITITGKAALASAEEICVALVQKQQEAAVKKEGKP